MINNFKADAIEKGLCIKYNYLDFFYPFCAAKGYEDPEGDENMTDELYDELETEFFKKFNLSIVDKIKNKIWELTEEEIKNEMEKIA